MAKKLRKFKLAGTLPRMTRQQVQLTNALLCHLPQTTFEQGFKEKLCGVLAPLLHADVDVFFEGVRALGDGELRQTLGEPMCAAVLGLPPRTEKALLEVDLAIAQLAIDKLLGGDAEDADGQRPLSEIEDGVFSFVLLKALQVLQEDALAEKQAGLKLEGVHGTLGALVERFAVDARYLCLSFKLFFDVKVGYARLYLPESLVKDAFPDALPTSGVAQQRWLARLADRIDIVRPLTAPLVIEVGRIGLQMSDVEALEVDDIILVEQTEVRMTGGGDRDAPGSLGGRVHARLGGGHHGVISGDLVVGESARYEVQIEAIAPTGEPRARGHLFREDSTGESMESENAKRLSTAGLLGGGSSGGDAGWAADLRGRLAARALAAPPSGRSRTSVPEASRGRAETADRGAEHSDGYDDDEAAPPAPEAAGLLDDITVAMVVELGRVMVSASDVVQLRAGQVIELSRAPGEPVDLVVDGRRIGKGELVEIDGELGVRILSLVK